MAIKFLNTVAVDNDVLYVDASANKVGIGTNTLTSTLTVSSDAAGDSSWDKSGILIENTSTTTGEPTLAFRNAGTGGTGANYWFTGLNQSNIYRLAYGTSFVDGNTMLALSSTGALTLNAYTQGFLQTDANGNVSTSGGGTLPGGPFLPLTAGSTEPLSDTLYGTGATFGDTTVDVATVTIEGGQAGILDIWRNGTNASYQAIRFRDNTNANTEASIGWGSNQLRLNGTDTIIATTGGDERMRITSTGKVGINATNVQDALDIDWDTEGVATDNSGIRVRAYRPHLNLIDRSGYSTSNGHNFQIKADLAKLWFNATSADDETFDLTRMVIDKDGNVGMGTTSPDSLLEISKQLSAASTIDYPYTISSRDDGNSINQAGGEGVGIKFRIAGNDGTTPGNSLVGASIAAIKETASDTDSSTGLGFFVTQNDETLDEAIRIDHDGNVGIGTTSPKSKLDVNSVFCVDSKEHTITNAFTTCLTVNLTDHTGCHVVITAFGDWPDHSSAAYRGEFFLQNGGPTNVYNEPGIILRQDDNTAIQPTAGSPDQIICQIVDPTSTANPKDFQIQIRHTDATSPASFVAQLAYTVQGKFNSIT